MKKNLWIVLSILFILALPWVIWLFSPSQSLDVTILDKTVPDESAREHKSLTWLLNYNKYKTNEKKSYDSMNYYGLVSDEEKQTIEEKPLPEDLGGTDLIYVADTYGVYKQDLPWTEETDEGPPELIEGGLAMDEWQQIKQQVESNGKDLIMEFNSFASPTSESVRNDVTDFLKVDWQGWIGRYFPDLSEGGEVPAWVVSRFEEKGETWTYEGEGVVLIHEFSGEVVVLSLEDGDLQEAKILALFNEKGEEHFNLQQSTPYLYWFDILEPQKGADVLAEYEIQTSDKGQEKLETYGIPSTFPAVTYHQEQESDRYYFSGDYADLSDVPSIYQYQGFAKVREWVANFQPDSEESFFWSTYRPMMESILSSAATKEQTKTVSAHQAVTEKISHPSRVHDQKIEVFQDNEWQSMTMKGVNIGMGKPGYFPGEAAIEKEEYARWFEQIGEMNANAIRVYTLHPPGFYEALAEYNADAEEPLYVFHGVWIDEGPLEETEDAFNEESTTAFQEEMKKIVDVIHGEAKIPAQTGHASGLYTKDISPYVVGWIIGIEWFPKMVDQMEKDYPDLGDYEGTYTLTEGASPMEYWLAEQMDVLTSYEIEEYQSMRPLSFTNWVTTDNLDQPAEPLEQEDMASIDPNHIFPKGEAEAVGMFASYHVYPYYPDFLNIEESYTEFEDHRGERNNYAGYLKDLHDSHELPILIAEFGIPASRGKTHENPFGWNQGFISEKEQGEIVKRLYEDILHEELLGGLVFSWQDEWFKRTWNTMDYDNPDRRPYWSNAQTNEQQFGLLSFDRLKVKVDGKDDWEEGESLYEDGKGDLESLMADHDERYLYLKAKVGTEGFWKEKEVQFHISVRPDKGIQLDGQKLVSDFRVTIPGEEDAKIEVARDYDVFHYDYVEKLKMTEDPYAEEDFHPIRLALNKGLVRPDTGEKFPFDSYETGVLRYGVGDPESEDYDSLADYYFSEETAILEIRLPWMLLNAKDPSQKEFIGDLYEDGLDSSISIDGLDITASVIEQGDIVDSFGFDQPARYTWDNWDLPLHEERLKKSYPSIRDIFSTVK
ncbi:hypothetical protein [Halobacillus faecis]|uniref:Family 2 glycosyl transferase n=1 Tax=Halobacillus faecis TaxID=360184 RepID=A0A511WQ85_9BACI|nr:hypothetical protein [Halobacillus faecis]GEN52611.1 hypothetical protein HFA01_08730 [Halobacillus faecis]